MVVLLLVGTEGGGLRAWDVAGIVAAAVGAVPTAVAAVAGTWQLAVVAVGGKLLLADGDSEHTAGAAAVGDAPPRQMGVG